ncbi:DNA replication and repair protein RecO [Spongiibacter sp. IMCC21906]|uniref:DNA repair protein RecO n=1 Tax=Spongiibacter sp. IMCC21906 TaxID=1620392 RepID=UPI00062E00B6|nr:DNA repair protein RecO [Spongiibacter sp. IMCC21906]AKH69511.1 DNA replication and repair protein RecO [Spongiibacter sp. IMCC21906]
MKRVEGEPCFILHQRPYRETSALLEVFSLDHGRFSVIAKGLRGGSRGRQAWRSALQPFNLLALSWSGRGELKTLTDAQLQKAFSLQGRALFCGFYLNELLERLLHRFDPHQNLFHHYQYSLDRLLNGEDEKRCLRRFEFSLLADLGYGFSLHLDGNGEGIIADNNYVFLPEQGFIPARQQEEIVFSGTHLLELAKDDYSAEAELTGRRLSRLLLGQLLGSKPLRSRELFAATFASDSSGKNHR